MLRSVSSCTEITEASEEFFNALTASLPRAGTMVRIACGAMIRRINTKGVIAGFYADSAGLAHSFLRAADGTITTIDPSGASESEALSINSKGAVTGWDLVGTVFHGFTRSASGTFIQFDPTGSTATYALSINSGGSVTGYYIDGGGIEHAFIRNPKGKIVKADPPGSTGAEAFAINAKGTITGYFGNGSGGAHGFLRTK